MSFRSPLGSGSGTFGWRGEIAPGHCERSCRHISWNRRTPFASFRRCTEQASKATVGGGWAIDALLGRQTRPHSDLDLWVVAEDLEALTRTLVDLGFDRLFPWVTIAPGTS